MRRNCGLADAFEQIPRNAYLAPCLLTWDVCLTKEAIHMKVDSHGNAHVGGSVPMTRQRINASKTDLTEQNHALAYAYMCIDAANLESVCSDHPKYMLQLDEMLYAFQGEGLAEDRAFYARMLQKPKTFPFWVRYAWLFCRLMQRPTSNTHKDPRDGSPVTLINLLWPEGTPGMNTETNGLRAARAINVEQVISHIGRDGFALPRAPTAGDVYDGVVERLRAKKARKQARLL